MLIIDQSVVCSCREWHGPRRYCLVRSLGVTIDIHIVQSVVCSCREWHGLRRYRRVRSLGVTRDDIACIYENVWGKPPTASL